jgi:hypothetical protein
MVFSALPGLCWIESTSDNVHEWVEEQEGDLE